MICEHALKMILESDLNVVTNVGSNFKVNVSERIMDAQVASRKG